MLAAFVHDLGKCNWGFQRKIVPGVPAYEWAGHVGEVAPLLSTGILDERFGSLPPVEQMVGWGDEAPVRLLTAVVSHHKQPLVLPCGLADPRCRLWAPRHGVDPWRNLGAVVARAGGGLPRRL